MKMNRYATFVLALAAAGLLTACGGGSTDPGGVHTPDSGNETAPETTPGQDQGTASDAIAATSVTDLLALGARTLTEADIRAELVGARLRNVSEEDGRRTYGWTWIIREDGTSDSRGARGEGDWPSTWFIENGQYCRTPVGEDGPPGCSTVYELDGIYRFSARSGDAQNLTGWSVTVGGWDAGQLLYDGETLTARNLSAMRLAQEEGNAELIDPVDFSIRRTEDGDYVVIFDGFEHTFTPDQRTSWGFESGDDDIALSNWNSSHEELDAGHSDGDYAIVFRATRDHEEVEGTNPELRAFAVVGNPTSDFSRMNDVTATFEGGFAYLDLMTASFDNFDWDEDRLELRSREGVALTANFANSTVSGSIRDFAEDDGTPYDITLTMPETTFGTEGFSGNFDVSGGAVHQTTASYDASFWGPDANQVVGTMSIAGTAIDDEDPIPFVGVGWFGANQTD